MSNIFSISWIYEAPDINEPAGVEQLLAGDYDGDADIDVILARIHYPDAGGTPVELMAFGADGNGNFTDVTDALFSSDRYAYFPAYGLTGDFNHDGRADLYLADFGMDAHPFPGAEQYIYLSGPTGQLTKHALDDEKFKQTHSAAAGDINNDGITDLLLGSLDQDSGIEIFLGAVGKSPSKMASSLLPPEYAGGTAHFVPRTSVLLVDVDQDGLLDLVAGSYHPASGEVLRQYPETGFGVISTLPQPGAFGSESIPITIDIKPLDLNGDAFPDLVVAINDNYNRALIQLLVNDGSGNFHDETELRFQGGHTLPLTSADGAVPPYWFKLVHVYDFNGDGHSDLLVSPYAGQFTLFFNDGNGAFPEHVLFEARNPVPFDADADGDVDIFAFQYNRFVLFENETDSRDEYRLNFNGQNVMGSEHGDLFVVRDGFSRIDAGAGIDVIELPGLRSEYEIRHGQALEIVHGMYPRNTVAAADVERLVFADMSLAFDLDGDAGLVARIIGAVFGASALGNAEYVGIGLTLLGNGSSYDELLDLALRVALPSGRTNASVVNLLYTNLVGEAPPPAQSAYFEAMLENGSFTQVSLARFAAEHELNVANIDLVGLAATGIEYVI